MRYAIATRIKKRAGIIVRNLSVLKDMQRSFGMSDSLISFRGCETPLRITNERGASRGQAAGVPGFAASNLFKRAFRRLAAFLWMMPRLVALSSAEMSERMSSVFDFVAARFCNEPRRLKTRRLRRARPGI